MKTYTIDEMKRAFECGRNFQLTGENNFQELIEELNQALHQPLVSGRSEQLKALMHFAEFAKEEYGLHIPLNLIKEYVKAFNCH